MKKAVVVYYSKYGHTKKYAEMISKRLGCDIFKLSEVNEEKLFNYDIIIYGGPIIQDMIKGLNKFTTNQDDFDRQLFVIFADGMLMKTDLIIKRIIKENFSEEDLKRFKFFYFPGGFEYERLDYGDMLIINFDVAGKNNLVGDNKAHMMRRLYNKKYDFVSEKHIEELISYVNELMKEDE